MDCAEGTDAERSRDLDSDDVVTVEELNGQLNELIASTPAVQHDYVVGDVSEAREVNGHLHFDLVHDGASIHCVVFGVEYTSLSTAPSEELRVAVRGEIDLYEKRGSCSIVVSDVVEVGESETRQVYERNRQRLAADGLLDDARKQSLPDIPATVGLVTSADSDARTDAQTAIHVRHPDVDILVQDATVQGDRAMQEVMAGVTRLDEHPEVDVIVLTRGCGADETLRVFDETPVCRVVANADTPVVAAIGHEDDRTLVGEVADERVMTPTDVGTVVPRRAALEENIAAAGEQLDRAYRGAVAAGLDAYRTALEDAYTGAVETTLDDHRRSLEVAYTNHVETELTALATGLDHAFDSHRRAREHQAEKEAVASEAREEVAASFAAERRRYRGVIVALGVLVLALLAYVLVA